MTDIYKISELHEKDIVAGKWEEWPFPTVTITSRIVGDLRKKIFQLTNTDPGSIAEVLLIEREISGGWSEYTQEDDYEIEVTIAGRTVWESNMHYSAEHAMAQFLAWIK